MERQMIRNRIPPKIFSTFVISFILIPFILISFSLALSYSARGAGPVESWNKTYGGEYGDGAWSLQELNEGGYILVGNTATRGEGSDLWLIRTDQSGNPLWSRILGGSGEDVGYFVKETNDGGFIITGSAKSFGMGEERLWLIKTDGNGSRSWDKTFGGFVSSTGDGGWSVSEARDGGYIVAGYTKSQGNGGKDLWLLKTDDQGNKIWDYTYGGMRDDVGISVLQGRDGGYIAAGRTASFGKGGDDIWLLKTDSRGIETWNVTFGGSKDDAGFQVVELMDGYALVGRTESGTDSNRIILIRTDLLGRELAEKTYLGSSGTSLQLTEDGGFIIAGRIDSKESGRDALIIKTDSIGEEEWRKILGGKADDIGTFAVQNRDGDYVLAGITSSFGSGAEDAWLIKMQTGLLAPEDAARLQNLTRSFQAMVRHPPKSGNDSIKV
jgi:hypothetical protein